MGSSSKCVGGNKALKVREPALAAVGKAEAMAPESGMVSACARAGLAAYCHQENEVALGFVEGLNNKIRVLQRRAYGLRDEEYVRLKILTCMLPTL